MNTQNTQTEPQVRLLASSQTWIESEAVRQLYAAAKLEGVQLAVGFPDLHPGKTTPVGAAFVTEQLIYPHLIGADIGCGMALFKTNLVLRDVDLDCWAELPFELEHPWDELAADILAKYGLASSEFDAALGTIGGGNHFAEVQAVEKIVDAAAFRKVGLSKQQLVLLVHSGSRGLGKSILQSHDRFLREPIEAQSLAGVDYLHGHDIAVRWASANRELIARRFAGALGAQIRRLWDGCHNSISRYACDHATRWVHRKGAVAANTAVVVIPGSRGSPSYLVKPTGDGASHAWSLAHGAGRRWTRCEARRRMRERFGMRQLVQTPLGGRVVCEERDLLYEEAPAAYKDIETVIQDLVDTGMVSVIATLRPLLTYKTRRSRR